MLSALIFEESLAALMGVGIALIIAVSSPSSLGHTTNAARDTDVSPGGDTSVSVEGKDLAGLDLSSVTCVKQGGKINVASGAMDGQAGLGIVMTDEERPKVESLSVLVDGVALAVSSMAGAELGSAKVAVPPSLEHAGGQHFVPSA